MGGGAFNGVDRALRRAGGLLGDGNAGAIHGRGDQDPKWQPGDFSDGFCTGCRAGEPAADAG